MQMTQTPLFYTKKFVLSPSLSLLILYKRTIVVYISSHLLLCLLSDYEFCDSVLMGVEMKVVMLL